MPSPLVLSNQVASSSTQPSRAGSILGKVPPTAGVELVPEGKRPLKRSRTGCLTCRKRKKKCPEEYEGGACVRCKAGGWKCIRTRAEIERKRTSSSNGLMTMDTLDEEDDDSPSSNHPSDNANSFSFPSANPFGKSAGRSTSTAPRASGPMSREGDAAMTEDQSLSWLSMDLESLLAQSLPALDMAMYQSMGELAPISSDTVPYSQDDLSSYLSSITANTNLTSGSTTTNHEILTRTFPTPITPQVESILSDFYDRFLAPLWAVTYPPGTREVMLGRHKHVASSHALNKKCKEAAAAMYIKLLRESRHMRGSITGVAGSDDLLPYLELQVDAEAIAHEATYMARGPKDSSLTVEAHLWALEDLHMSVSALFEGSRAYAIMDHVEQLLSHTYGPRPDIDFDSRVGVSAFCLRAFAMIDWNRSLCQRRETFFNFDFVPANGTATNYANDGAHDNWFGLPSSLAIILARVFNLIARVHQNPSVGVPTQISIASSTARKALSTYIPAFTVFDVGKPRHSAAMAAELAVEQEIWRTLGLILVDRHLLLKSPFDPIMRDNITLMLSLLRSLPTLSAIRKAKDGLVLDWWSSFYTTPAFLVGSLMTDLADRNFIRRFLKESGPEKSLEDMLVILECTWGETDRTGIVADWHQEMTRLGLSIIFF